MGACFGFLWWNASPAKIFMGDTGSLALGGALAGIAILSRTELLLVLIGGLFVLIALSVIVQVGFFKLTGRRVFRMAPLQHHFELVGWGEVTIVIRFWIIAGLLVALGLGVFYAEWVTGARARERSTGAAGLRRRAGRHRPVGGPGAAVAGRAASWRSTAATATGSARWPTSCGPPASRSGSGDARRAARRRRPGRHLTRLAAGPAAARRRGRARRSRSGATSSWPGGCGPAGQPWLGVTGTNGKTTTVQMLASILARGRPPRGRDGQRRASRAGRGARRPAVRRARGRGVQLPAALDLDRRVRRRRGAQPRARPPRLARLAGGVRRRQGARLARRLVRRRTTPTTRSCRALGWRGSRTRQSFSPRATRVPASPWSATQLVDRGSAPTRASRSSAVADGGVVLAERGRRPGCPARTTSRTRWPPPRSPARCTARPAAGSRSTRRRAAGLRAFDPGAHRIAHVATVDGVDYVDDSKATNAARGGRVAAGVPARGLGRRRAGQGRAASTSSSRAAADRLRGAVLIGEDRALIAEALARHAPEIPVVEVAGTDTGPMDAP